MDAEAPTSVRVTVFPLAPQTVESLYRDVPIAVRDALAEQDEDEVLARGELTVQSAPDLPGGDVAAFVIALLTPQAVALAKRVILPRLEGEYQLQIDWKVRVTKTRKKKARRRT